MLHGALGKDTCWAEAVYPLWWPILTKDLQKVVRVGLVKVTGVKMLTIGLVPDFCELSSRIFSEIVEFLSYLF